MTTRRFDIAPIGRLSCPARTMSHERMGKWAQVLVAVAVLGMLAACTTSNAGNPTPEPNSPPSRATTSVSTTSTTPSSTTRLLPPRPRDMDLTSVDPCKDVLTQDQLRQLAYDLGYQRAPGPGHVVTDNGRTCTYSSSRPTDQPSRDIGSLVIVSTSAGAEVWLTDPGRKSSADLARMTTVAGFPALVLPNPSFVANCAVAVDVNDGQYLGVQSRPSGGAEGTSPDPYCAEAQHVAELIVQNLLARK
jgi:Protein of unknown function (DUF3558)